MKKKQKNKQNKTHLFVFPPCLWSYVSSANNSPCVGFLIGTAALPDVLTGVSSHHQNMLSLVQLCLCASSPPPPHFFFILPFLPAYAAFYFAAYNPPPTPSTLFVMKSLICWIPRKADYAYFSFGQSEMEPGVWQQQSVQV